MKISKQNIAGCVKAIIAACVDQVENYTITGGMQASTIGEMASYRALDGSMTEYESSALETAGWALSILYAQTTGDGMGVGDAIDCSGLGKAIETFVAEAWGEPQKILERVNAARQKGSYRIPDIYDNYPDVNAITIKFMEYFDEKVFVDLEFDKDWIPPELKSNAQEIRIVSTDMKMLGDLVDWLNEQELDDPKQTTIHLNC